VNPVLYELPVFEHVDAGSVEEALFWLHKQERAKVIAGGTDLLGMMKDRITGPRLWLPDLLVNIKSIAEMNRIFEEEEGGIRIGGAVTLRQVEMSPVMTRRFRALHEAVRQVGSNQIRSLGTMAGNLCQRPRCIYFRHTDFICFKKGGNRCYAPGGEHRYYHAIMDYGKCAAVHPSDLAPALIALNARAIVKSLIGVREIPLRDLFPGPDDLRETALQSDELLFALRVPHPGENTAQCFLKHRVRHAVDFSLSSVAAVAHLSQGICEDIRIVLGGIAPFPLEALKSEEITRGRMLDDRTISEAAEAATKGARPLPMNHYKVDLTKALVRRALTELRTDIVENAP
jgi:xanthine dehydrogenase YagS FAD-binding subunit